MNYFKFCQVLLLSFFLNLNYFSFYRHWPAVFSVSPLPVDSVVTVVMTRAWHRVLILPTLVLQICIDNRYSLQNKTKQNMYCM